jgi:hypothetical protein
VFFINKDTNYTVSLNSEGEAIIPAAALSQPTMLFIGCYGEKGSLKKTTTRTHLIIKEGIIESSETIIELPITEYYITIMEDWT